MRIFVAGLIITLSLVFSLNPIAFAGSPAEKVKKIPDPERLTDLHGDALPKGAVARLGTVRWRHRARMLLYSPDGRYLAASGTPTRVFDARTGRLVHLLDIPANFLFFSRDGKTLLTTIHDPPLMQFWELATGKEQRRLPLTSSGSFSWSADTQQMLLQGYRLGEGWSISFWDTKKGKELRRWPTVRGDSLALSPDGKSFALWEESSIVLRNILDGKARQEFPNPFEQISILDQTRTMTFSPDGKMLACAGAGHVCLYDTTAAKDKPRVLRTTANPTALAISADGRILAAGDVVGTLYVWDLATDKLLHTFREGYFALPVDLLTLAPDGKTLAAQARGPSPIRVWDLGSGKEILTNDANFGPVQIVAFRPDGKVVGTVGPRDPVRLWDPATGKLLLSCSRLGNFNLDTDSTLTLFSDNKTLAVTARQGRCLIGDSITGDLLQDFLPSAWQAKNQTNQYLRLHPGFSPDSKNILGVLSTEDNPGVPTTEVGLWDARTGKRTRSFVTPGQFQSPLLTPDGKTLLGLGTPSPRRNKVLLFVWDMATGQRLRRVLLPSWVWTTPMRCSADGRTLISGPKNDSQTKKSKLFLWEVATGQMRAEVECKGVASNTPPLVFAIVSDRMAAVAQEKIIYVFDPATGKELRRLEGQENDIRSLAFSPDGRYLASGSEDSTTLIWDLRDLSPGPLRLTAEELGDRWEDLASSDASLAYRAIRQMSRAPEQSLDFLKERLKPVSFEEMDKIHRLIAKLNSEHYPEREEAIRELTRLGELVEPVLQEVVKTPSSLEMRRRAEAILEKLHQTERAIPVIPSGEALRELRALEVVEKIGTKDAELLLARLTKGAPLALLTREARTSWQRLKK